MWTPRNTWSCRSDICFLISLAKTKKRFKITYTLYLHKISMFSRRAAYISWLTQHSNEVLARWWVMLNPSGSTWRGKCSAYSSSPSSKCTQQDAKIAHMHYIKEIQTNSTTLYCLFLSILISLTYAQYIRILANKTWQGEKRLRPHYILFSHLLPVQLNSINFHW